MNGSQRPAIPEPRARKAASRDVRAEPEATPQERSRRLQREWWLRVPMLFYSPRPVFVAMRDQSNEAVTGRQEPILAIILVAGIASVLQTSVVGRLLDDPQLDGGWIFVWAVIGGVLYGIASYWIGGAALYLGTRAATVKHGPKASFIQARHVLGYAAAPIALSLLVWPFRLAVYGSDIFRTGGADTGAGPKLFDAIGIAFIVWSFGLLVYGVRTTYRWSWLRALGTMLLAVLALLCVVVIFGIGRVFG